MFSKVLEWLLYATFIVAVGGLELAALRIIEPATGMYCFLAFFVTWAATFGDM